MAYSAPRVLEWLYLIIVVCAKHLEGRHLLRCCPSLLFKPPFSAPIAMKPFVDDKGRSLSQAPLEENAAGKGRAGDPSVPQSKKGA